MIKPAYSVSFLLSVNIFVWQNVLYFPNDLHIFLSHATVQYLDSLSEAGCFVISSGDGQGNVCH